MPLFFPIKLRMNSNREFSRAHASDSQPHNNHNLPHTHSTSPLPTTMSQDDAGPLRRLQVAIDILGEQDSVQEGVYLNACEALKEIHSLSNLYKVSYYEFVAERGEHGLVVSSRKRVRIMPRDDDHADVRNWSYALDRGSLPHDMTHLAAALNNPFGLGDNVGIVTEVAPYLKRSREDEQQ